MAQAIYARGQTGRQTDTRTDTHTDVLITVQAPNVCTLLLAAASFD